MITHLIPVLLVDVVAPFRRPNEKETYLIFLVCFFSNHLFLLLIIENICFGLLKKYQSKNNSSVFIFTIRISYMVDAITIVYLNRSP